MQSVIANLQIVGLLITRNNIFGRQRNVRCQCYFGSCMDDFKGISYGVLLLRLTAGIALLAHSLYLKVFVFTMSGTSSFLSRLACRVCWRGWFSELRSPRVQCWCWALKLAMRPWRPFLFYWVPPGRTRVMAGCSAVPAGAGSTRHSGRRC